MCVWLGRAATSHTDVTAAGVSCLMAHLWRRDLHAAPPLLDRSATARKTDLFPQSCQSNGKPLRYSAFAPCSCPRDGASSSVFYAGSCSSLGLTQRLPGSALALPVDLIREPLLALSKYERGGFRLFAAASPRRNSFGALT